MENSEYILDAEEQQRKIDIKEILSKYAKYWPWFIVTFLFFITLSYVYSRYAAITYTTKAKIKILDESKELEINLDPSSLLEGTPKLNIDNEVEILKSYRLISQVVEELDLDVEIFQVGKIKKTEVWNKPFVITNKLNQDSIPAKISYIVEVEDNKLKVLDQKNREVYNPNFKIELAETFDSKNYLSAEFEVVVKSKKDAVLKLIKDLKIKLTNKKSEIIEISLLGENSAKSEAILNTLIDKFNQDGILDRQLVSKRTLDFIDKRFLFLSNELDSIEVNKKSYKQSNNLSYIESDASTALKQKSLTDEEVFNLENQLSLSRLLKKTLKSDKNFSLLPADIGLASNSINVLVSDYNKIVLEREKIAESAGASNPLLQSLNGQLKRLSRNINQTVNVYIKQLEISLSQLRSKQRISAGKFSKLPEKEKILRAIERQQNIKENLFILLLQKREEAAISLAVTSPTVKVVDYALTGSKPVTPNKKKIYGLALLLSIILPLLLLSILFILDTKVRNRKQIENANPKIPIIAEFPNFEDEKLFSLEKRSVLVESYRILCANVNYLIPLEKTNSCKTIFITSAVAGEGKTLTSINLALAYASLKKKVLLVGADLRNPQLHTYFNVEKNTLGLSSLLHDANIKWQDCIQKNMNKNKCLDVCFSGMIPPNPPELLSNNAFKTFVNTVKEHYEYIIFDTAPTLPVSDTLNISKYADVTLFMVRANKSDKALLSFSKELHESGKLSNMAYIVNDVAVDNLGYGSKYSYVYGEEARTINKGIFSKIGNIKNSLLKKS
ncbi:GumC family protein [Aquimarina agarivorans]|uniref:GumC family protein n=1 Tax=Aquimarina agarivorans TaxID=980584 RepID=UPI000248E857|nr:tyrosine-protein kinase family protein [Aquimarina agarivorans]